MDHLPPLILERRLDSRIWGGTTLGPWLGLFDPPAQLAESWQVYEQNKVIDGPFAGRALGELVQEHGAALVGARSFERWGADFPLLAKFIDAADDLSVQVHPQDEYAHTVAAETGFHGKTEAWYILQAAPGAQVIHGFRAATDRDTFIASVQNNTLLEHLRYVPVRAGDTIFVPAGTVHAINKGILLFEIQQKSDLTYRVYDYDRRDATGKPRDLHLDRAVEVSNYDNPLPARQTPQPLAPGRFLLVECPYFAMERWQIAKEQRAATDPATFEILTSIEGSCRLVTQGRVIDLPRGTSVVLPASLGAYRLIPRENATLLRCYVP